MVEISLLDKIRLTCNLIFSSPLFLILIFGFALMLVDIYLISKKSKATKITYLLISLVIIGILLQKYLNSLFNIFDTIAKNIVTIIYFPSILEYILILLMSLIILLVGSISKKTNKKVKTINLFVFAINMFIFFLILDQIGLNDIDLTNKISIYSNENLMALFELSVFIFVVWIIGLILYKVIYKLTHKEKIVGEANNFYQEPKLPKTIEELRQEILIPPPQVEYIVVEKKKDNEEQFTLEEYKLLRQYLEDMKKEKTKNDEI